RPPDAVDVRELRPLARRLQELLQVLVEELDGAAAAVLEPEGEAASGAESLDRGRREREHVRLHDLLAEYAVQLLQDSVDVQLLPLALVPRIEGDEVEGGVGRGRSGEEAEPGDRRDVLDALRLAQDLLDLLADRVGTLERRGVGKLDVDEEVALILV